MGEKGKKRCETAKAFGERLTAGRGKGRTTAFFFFSQRGIWSQTNGDSFPYGLLILAYQIQKLKRVQNAAARLVSVVNFNRV